MSQSAQAVVDNFQQMVGTDGGPRELSISTRRWSADDLLVAVCDSGPGVALEDRERVFESFYTTKEDGVGIGLSICRSILDVHGGRLWVEEHQPRGAAFRFTVPTHAGNPCANAPAHAGG